MTSLRIANDFIQYNSSRMHTFRVIYIELLTMFAKNLEEGGGGV